jgi:hypothetical protein
MNDITSHSYNEKLKKLLVNSINFTEKNVICKNRHLTIQNFKSIMIKMGLLLENKST